MKKIILLGGGGHCKVVLDAILLGKKYEVVGIIDTRERIGDKVFGIPIIVDDRKMADYFKKGIKYCFITVGSIGNPNARIRLFNLASRAGFIFPNIIHPNTTISKFVKIGYGNYFAASVIVNAGVNIGNNCILNTGSIIDHDCNIGDFVHIAPGVTISGGVSIGRGSHIGTGSSIVQSIKIGRNSIIGAGSVIVKDIQDNIIVYGTSCRKIRNNEK